MSDNYPMGYKEPPSLDEYLEAIQKELDEACARAEEAEAILNLVHDPLLVAELIEAIGADPMQISTYSQAVRIQDLIAKLQESKHG